MELYNKLRAVPVEAQKTIESGRLAGMTNITPQWRYQQMTAVFGPCGIGWKADPPTFAFQTVGNGQTIVFCSTNLYVRTESGEWSDPIHGEGGNLLMTANPFTKELEPNDEACKSAFTDAISSAAKMLGLAADIYFRTGDGSKYRASTDMSPFGEPETVVPEQGRAYPEPVPAMNPQTLQRYPQPTSVTCADCGAPISSAVANFSSGVFGRPLCMSCQTSAKTTEQASASAYNRIPSPTPAYGHTAPVNAVMDREQALAYVLPFGGNAGQTIGSVLAAGGNLSYYLQDRFRDRNPDLYNAVRIALGA